MWGKDGTTTMAFFNPSFLGLGHSVGCGQETEQLIVHLLNQSTIHFLSLSSVFITQPDWSIANTLLYACIHIYVCSLLK